MRDVSLRRSGAKLKHLEVEVASSELVGLLPQDALSEEDVDYLRIENFSPSRLLEFHLADLH